FRDWNIDQSNYSDSDIEAEGPILYAADGHILTGSGSQGGSDLFKTHDRDRDLFGTSDTSHVVLNSTTPAGGKITVTIDDESSDNGMLSARDALADVEMLPPGAPPGTPGTPGEIDNISFSDSAGEKDVARDKGKIVIETLGLVKPGDYVNSTEMINIKD